MRKMRLNPEDLVVDGFPTTRGKEGRGTIVGRDSEWTMGCTNTGNYTDPGIGQTGFDIHSATGCAHCVCPREVNEG